MMHLTGIILARNEEWCLNASARAALRWCDSLVILDHASTDGTPQIIDTLKYEFPDRVHRLHEQGAVFTEMAMRQRCLEEARKAGATHLALIDADEILTENLVLVIRDEIARLKTGEVLQLPWIHCWRSLDAYRFDPGSHISRYMVSMAVCDAPSVRWAARDGYDHHNRQGSCSVFRKPWTDKTLGGVMHLQHVEWDRVLMKQAWYQAQELLRWGKIRANYAGTLDEQGLQTAAVPVEWWGQEKSLIRFGIEPWQCEEVSRMVAQNQREKFAAATLIGVT